MVVGYWSEVRTDSKDTLYTNKNNIILLYIITYW
jgi:hypothetical protein